MKNNNTNMFTQTNRTTANEFSWTNRTSTHSFTRRIFLLIMGLPVRKELPLMGLLGGTLLSQMGLLGRTELVLTTLNIDLLKETGSRTGTVRGNVGKFSKFKLKSAHCIFVTTWNF